jgi:2-oxo-3-hexenedioate decarboxylase
MSDCAPAPGAGFDPKFFAERLDAARRARVCLTPFAQSHGVTEAQAYAIQACGMTRRLKRSERLIGVKLGFTSEAMRRQMGIATANIGFLTNAMMITPAGGLDRSQLIDPRAEPEIVLRLGADLHWPADLQSAAAAVAACAPAIEIVDSRFQDYRFTLQDNIADNSSAAAFVLGEWRDWPCDLDDLNVRLTIDEAVVEEGNSSAALGHPLNALLEAARLAALQDRHLKAGEILLTGGLTAAPQIHVGQRVGTQIAGLGEVGFDVRG